MKRYELPQQEKAILEHLRQAFAVYQFVDKRVAALVLSDGFCQLFGYEDRAQAYYDMDNNMYRNTHPDDTARIANAAVRFATEGGRFEVIYRSRKRNSPDYLVIHAMGEHVYTEDGTRLAHVWYTNEGTYVEGASKQSFELTSALSNALHEQSMIRASQYDDLTGLPSMSYFFELAEAGKNAILSQGGQPMVLYIDFSGMKFYNTNYGFAEGDRILQSFTRLLVECFSNESCCRIAADHFAVMTEETDLEDKLYRIFRQFGELHGGKTPPVHVGIYPHKMEDIPISSACDRAKLACSTLKASYSSGFRYYSDELRKDAVLRQYIVENFDNAIKNQWIQVYLQPITRAVNEKVCDVEALARWIDPKKGILSPASFIPALEDAGLIYKLDLYMVDQILESIKSQRADNFYVVPHSINLSRSDFDACDMVEEIRRRVDAAGISRDKITIEITESMIGSDFEFMKEQVERFQRLGFPVWMDDFGSGYSSLDVLQSIKFDLIKFDMSFMRKLDESENSKTILTELMRMATALGVDTVCEGVETAEQVRFLQGIGCSKLQGFYYSKPIPYPLMKNMRAEKSLIQHENPEESEYYESIGRVNLYDLGVITSDTESAFQHVYDTLPIAVLEYTDGKIRFIRTNRSYQDFVKRSFQSDLFYEPLDSEKSEKIFGAPFLSTIKQCCHSSTRVFFDEKLPDGSMVHFFIRRISSNPVTGSVAMAVVVLSITAPDESTTYADIARALAADFYSIYVIDLDSNEYLEYSSQVGGEEMLLERHGEDFFESAKRDAMTRIYEEDREPFLNLFTKENVVRDLDAQGVFTTTYRSTDTGTPMYVNMKITRMHGGNRIILGVSNIDSRMKHLAEEKRLRQEKVSLGRVAALAPDYIVLYTIDPQTGQYIQYSPSNAFAKIGLAQQGEDFFADVVLDAPKAIAPEDMERHLRVLTKDNMIREIKKNGFFTHHYRIVMDGKYVPVSLRATMVEEDDAVKIILGVTKDENEKYRRKLREAQKIEELNQTITSLLDHMPGMTFTKDAATGKYLTCNQAFAEYAHKAAPSGVVGLTDEQIFDAETAAHFVEDDQKALSMDKPYIFFEDVHDAVGNQRQFQTTKLKYVDSIGRLCLQGMCQDVTDMVRIQRENDTTKEAYEQARITSTIYTHLAHALAKGYTDIYYVNLDTDEFIEFHTDESSGVLNEVRRGSAFFERCALEVKSKVHADDEEAFVCAMNREFLAKALEGNQIFELTYRRTKDGNPFYVQMKVSRMKDDPRFIVIAVSDIDELMRQRRMQERIQEERIIYAWIHAITGNFIVIYVVDPETNLYREFSATNDYVEYFGRQKEGSDFFNSVRRDARLFAHPADLDRFLSVFTKENVLSEIERSGIFSWDYRLMMNGRPLYVQMKAAMVEEKEGPRLILGLNDINAQIRQKEEFERRLADAQSKANIDGLTGVKNKHAYLDAVAQIDRQIAEQRQSPFAIVIFDVNNLKVVNDTAGHQAGDQYLCDACKIICDTFQCSPVFRVGGDEFAVIAQRNDYALIEDHLRAIREHNQEALKNGGIVIACGMAKFQNDDTVAAVFERADHTMYENKTILKWMQKNRG